MKDRQASVLDATVEDYIHSVTPVGSKSLLQNHGFKCSPATIRHELNALDKEGYLVQPHSSSGRIPTEKGYRFYVDGLKNRLDKKSAEDNIVNGLSVVGSSVKEVLHHVSEVLSTSLNYTTLLMMPSVVQDTLKATHFVLLDMNRILIVLMTAMGVNKELLCESDHDLTQEELTYLSQLLSSKVTGKQVIDINEEMIKELIHELPKYDKILNHLLQTIKQFSSSSEDRIETACYGQAKLLQFPEFSDLDFAKEVMSLLEETQTLRNLFQKVSLLRRKQKVLIGEETGEKRLKECSVVMAPIEHQDTFLGTVCFLGPTRMQYSKLLPLVDSITERVDTFLKQEYK